MTRAGNATPLEKTRSVGPGEITRQEEFLFVEGMAIVGTIVADCAYCAWRKGSHKWPYAQMAMWGPVFRASRQKCFLKMQEDRLRKAGMQEGHLTPGTLRDRIEDRDRQN